MNIHLDTIPWYKQPLVWMLIAIPFSAVVMGVFLIYLAITTDDGLVADDYYKKGLTINRLLEKDELAEQYQLSATVDVDVDTGFIKVLFNKGKMTEYPTELHFTLNHATRQQNDISVVLQKGIENQYVGSITDGMQQGIWHFELNNGQEATEKWRLARRVNLKDATTIFMQAEKALL